MRPEWKTGKTYLGTNKQVFDAEVYAIEEVLDIALRNGQVDREASKQGLELRWTKVYMTPRKPSG